MKLYVLSRPTFDWGAFGQFLKDEKVETNAVDSLPHPTFNSSECLVQAAGRLCYMSYGKGRKTAKEFIDNLLESGHHSVLEHANWAILITGISRSCSHELVRHRHFSFSQLSQRFCDHSKVEPICPVAIAGDPYLASLWRKSVLDAIGAYNDLDTAMESSMKLKAHRTAARSVLPNATPTKILMTGNVRTWREFITKRNIEAADPEIREVAKTVRGMLVEEAPMLFGDLVA